MLKPLTALVVLTAILLMPRLLPGQQKPLHLNPVGVRPGSPEVEAGLQRVLSACKAQKIACAITANNANDVAKRVKEGWNIIRSTVPAINEGRALLGEK